MRKHIAKRVKLWLVTGTIAAATYGCASAWILAHPAEGSWSGFVVFMLGWPFSIVGITLAGTGGLAGVIACGTVQWFLVGSFLGLIASRVLRLPKLQNGA